jgi:hypothetical protein
MLKQGPGESEWQHFLSGPLGNSRAKQYRNYSLS